MYTLVAGLFEEKHATIEDCIRWETEEEAQLVGQGLSLALVVYSRLSVSR